VDLVVSTKFDLPPIAVPIVVLIGPPGVGKTTIGGALAQRLDCLFIDTDQIIQAATGLTVAEIFKQHGEPVFRALEKQLVAALAKLACAGYSNKKTSPAGTVVATGAGLPAQPGNFEELENLGKIVALTAAVPVLADRLALSDQRPLLNAAAKGEEAAAVNDRKNALNRLETLLAARTQIYARPQAQVNAENASVDEIVERIVQILSNYD